MQLENSGSASSDLSLLENCYISEKGKDSGSEDYMWENNSQDKMYSAIFAHVLVYDKIDCHGQNTLSLSFKKMI